MKTHILVVLDESGSMGPKRQDVIGGFNQFLEDQRKVEGDEAFLTLVKFNTSHHAVVEALPIERVANLSEASYTPGGNTALFDAIASALVTVDMIRCDRSICLIITDGEENSSRNTNFTQVSGAIRLRQDSGRWTFTYLGPDPEKWARHTGTHSANTMAYNGNVSAQMATTSQGLASFRSTGEKTSSSIYLPKEDETPA